jgi:hypothetical protein
MFLFINFTVRFFLNQSWIKISYLAIALSLGLRFTANMTDYFISLIVYYTIILCLVFLSPSPTFLSFIIPLELINMDNFSVSLSLFPAFIFRKDGPNNSESSNQLTSEPAPEDSSLKEKSSVIKETIIYTNSYEDKERILTDNKGKAGVYLWTHKQSLSP